MGSDRSPRASPMSEAEGAVRFLGVSPQARQIRRLIEKTARSKAFTLILGESGVGKEVVAREIHRLSSRADGPFVAINCASIPEGLIESELFGHEAGAFTDAHHKHAGAFEQANNGTLLLDEVAELSLSAQPKLLRALEGNEITKVGGEKCSTFNTRVVAATNKDLKALCRSGEFRSDLYYRLSIIEIPIPPLRRRPADIGVLAEHFLRELIAGYNVAVYRITEGGLAALQRHDWPGNGRELKHIIERSLVFTTGPILGEQAFDISPSERELDLPSLLEMDWKHAKHEFSTQYAKHLLAKHHGTVSDAADDAGVAVGSFYKWLRNLRIDV